MKQYECPPNKFEGGAFYSQYFEDYILSFMFQGQSTGSYVDVGANHPLEASVTRYFYEKGWNGINIDANPQFQSLYQRYRRRDINLSIGIAQQHRTLPFYCLSDQQHSDQFSISGLSTFDREIAENHLRNGFALREIQVPVVPLSEVVDHYGFREVDFLSVDVEGFEQEVLSSIDFDVFRPRAVVVEATAPLSSETTHDQWESILLKNGFQFSYFDGLNRYYIDCEQSDLVLRAEQICKCVDRCRFPV